MTARLACLHSDEASLVLECPPKGAPLWRHLGARVDVEGLAPLSATRTGASFSLDGDVPFQSQELAQQPGGLGLGHGERTLLCIPWSHVAGLCGVVLPFLQNASRPSGG
mgnify:CR=1 FL=1